MSTPGALRVERPYECLDAYLEGDAWTVERSDMLLVGVSSIAAGTSVKFEIVLSNGETVVKGEGRAVEAVAAKDGRPAGLRVRFRQLDGSSKATLKRALEVQKQGASLRAPVVKSSPVAAPPPPPEPILGIAKTEPAVDAEPSGVRHRAVGPVVSPGNREALLARLRERAPRGTAAE